MRSTIAATASAIARASVTSAENTSTGRPG